MRSRNVSYDVIFGLCYDHVRAVICFHNFTIALQINLFLMHIVPDVILATSVTLRLSYSDIRNKATM